jgi:hypothetical protein
MLLSAARFLVRASFLLPPAATFISLMTCSVS